MDMWGIMDAIHSLRTEVMAEMARLERVALGGGPCDLAWYRAMATLDGHLRAASAVARGMESTDRWTIAEEVRRG